MALFIPLLTLSGMLLVSCGFASEQAASKQSAVTGNQAGGVKQANLRLAMKYANPGQVRRQIPCRSGTGTRRCGYARICQTFKKPNYSRRNCWFCLRQLYPNSPYASMRRHIHRRHTCHKNVAHNLSLGGFKCMLVSSPYMSCKVKYRCRWFCRR